MQSAGKIVQSFAFCLCEDDMIGDGLAKRESTHLPDKATATWCEPPNGANASRAFLPNNFSR